RNCFISPDGPIPVATIRRVRGLLACFIPFVILAAAVGAPASAQATPTTIWDGVYSDAQARRGEQVFKTECSYCHKEDLSGGFFDDGLGRAPALAGKRAFDSSFIERWGGQTLAEMVATIAATMPQKRPASLTLQNYIDVASYLLAKKHVPAGPPGLPRGAADALGRSASVPRAGAAASPQAEKGAASPSYTAEQSARGEAIYTKSCGPCHEDKSLAPLLKGDVFVKTWSDKTAAALFDK